MVHDSSHEHTPLLSAHASSTKRTPSVHRLRAYWTQHVTTTRGDIALLFCYTITGLLDSASISTWGSFVSMQTGNTVYLGSGLVSPTQTDRWLRALISLLAFCTGSFLFSRFHRLFSGRRRWVIVTSYAVQLLLVLVSALIVQFGPPQSPSGKLDQWVVVPIALVAFQSAGQAVISRVLEFGSLTSVVLTSIYCDLFSDQALFSRDNVERNRRAAAPLLLLLGAAVGGLWHKTDVGISGALWTAAGLKGVVIVAWCFWSGAEDEDEEED